MSRCTHNYQFTTLALQKPSGHHTTAAAYSIASAHYLDLRLVVGILHEVLDFLLRHVGREKGKADAPRRESGHHVRSGGQAGCRRGVGMEVRVAVGSAGACMMGRKWWERVSPINTPI